MPRRPIDYTNQMQAIDERRRLRDQQATDEAKLERQLQEQQANSYGKVVQDILGQRITVDTLAGFMVKFRDQAKDNPQLEAEFAALGTAYFRAAGNTQRKQPAGSNRATGNGGNIPAVPPAPQPSHSRPATARATPDLLDGVAPDRPGTGAPEEGGGDDQHA